jgi:hypothetical protein
MAEFRIMWEGTVTGQTFVEANTIEEAIAKAKKSEDAIDIEYYPEDWEVDEELTKSVND